MSVSQQVRPHPLTLAVIHLIGRRLVGSPTHLVTRLAGNPASSDCRHSPTHATPALPHCRNIRHIRQYPLRTIYIIRTSALRSIIYPGLLLCRQS